MTEVVVEVGPQTIRGPNSARAEWVSAALDCIDDEIALIDDCPVSVQEVWHDVMSAIIGVGVDTAVLVCPAWWPSARVDKVRHAASATASTVVMLERTSMLRQGISARTTIVEIASEVVVVTALGTVAAVIPRHDESVEDAEVVVAVVGMPTAVLVDAPVGVPGAELLGALIGDRLRAMKISVRYADDDWVLRAADARRSCDRNQVDAVGVARSGVVPVGSAVGLPLGRAAVRRIRRGAWRRFGSTGRRYADDAVGRGQGRSCGAGRLDSAAHHIGAGIGSGTGCFTVRRRGTSHHAVREPDTVEPRHHG